MQARRLRVGDVALSVAEATPASGSGRPLMLVHGYGGAKEDFTEWLDPLAERGWHAVAPDLRGHGESDKPDDEAAYGFDVFAADVVGLAAALGWEQFALLGHSMGGMIAQLVVLERPALVDALILMDTTHGPVDWLDPDLLTLAATVLRERGVAAYVELADAMADDDPLASAAHLRLLRERAGYREFCRRKGLAAAAAMRLAMMPALTSQADRLERLVRLRIPTLVVVGEQDYDFVAPSERMAKTVPGARLAIVPDAGHSPQFEQPDAWWDAITSFLDGVD